MERSTQIYIQTYMFAGACTKGLWKDVQTSGYTGCLWEGLGDWEGRKGTSLYALKKFLS